MITKERVCNKFLITFMLPESVFNFNHEYGCSFSLFFCQILRFPDCNITITTTVTHLPACKIQCIVANTP